MPFKSDKQRRYLYANHPEIAKRWSREYADGGYVEPSQCYRNGGPVLNRSRGADPSRVLPADERRDPIEDLKGIAMTVSELTPIVGDVLSAKEIYDELQNDPINWTLVGILGGATVIGLFPGLGDAASKAIKAGAKQVQKLTDTIPKLSEGSVTIDALTWPVSGLLKGAEIPSQVVRVAPTKEEKVVAELYNKLGQVSRDFNKFKATGKVPQHLALEYKTLVDQYDKAIRNVSEARKQLFKEQNPEVWKRMYGDAGRRGTAEWRPMRDTEGKLVYSDEWMGFKAPGTANPGKSKLIDTTVGDTDQGVDDLLYSDYSREPNPLVDTSQGLPDDEII